MSTRRKQLTSSIHDIESLEKIKNAVGRETHFHFPGSEGDKRGTLKDRAIILSNPRSIGVPYWDVVDLIEFPDEKQKWIRIGYYRKPSGRLNWASQTTISEPVTVWKRLLVESAREKPWFRRLLESVMRELE